MKIEPKELKETADISAGHSDFKDKAIVLGTVALLFLGLYAVALGTSQILVHFYPDTVEKAIGKSVAEEFKQKTSTKKEFQNALTIFSKLKNVGLERQLDYQLCYISEELPNAFALPGGTICLTKGLLQSLKTEKGLAMVIGHEFGHHQKKHLLKRLTSTLIIQVMLSATIGVNFDGISGSLLNLYFSAWSRQQEYEADDYGVQLVQRGYGDTSGILEFFEQAEAKQGTGHVSKMATWLQTHPHMSDRIKRIRKNMQTTP